MLRWFGLRLGLPVIVVLAVMVAGGISSHNAAMVSGGLIAVLVIALITGIEVPLIIRSQARRRQRLMAASAPGALYAATVTPLSWSGNQPQGSLRSQIRNRGLLTLRADGFEYRPQATDSVDGAGPDSLNWSQVDTVTLLPRTPLAGRLEITTSAGTLYRWQVPGIPELTNALTQIASANDSL